jgi:hypothetical protein
MFLFDVKLRGFFQNIFNVIYFSNNTWDGIPLQESGESLEKKYKYIIEALFKNVNFLKIIN